MTAQRMTTTRDRIEIRYALGDLPDEIALRLGVRLAEVLRVGEAMDAAAREDDAPRFAQPRLCPAGLHEMTPDNLVARADKRRECLACKRDRGRAYYQQKKAS